MTLLQRQYQNVIRLPICGVETFDHWFNEMSHDFGSPLALMMRYRHGEKLVVSTTG